AMIPQRHGWQARAAFAAFAGLTAFFLIRTWVSEGVEPPTEVPAEPKTLLTWVLGLPIGGAIAVVFLPRQAHRLLEYFTLLVMLATFAVSAFLLGPDMGRTFHFNQDVVWLARFGIHYHVAIDGISLWLVLLTTFVTPIAAYASFGSVTNRIKDWCFALLLLEGALIGSFISLDLFLFYVFFELGLVPMYV